METIESKKENKEQVTFKDKDIWAFLKKQADEQKSSIGAVAKQLLSNAAKTPAPAPVKSNQVEPALSIDENKTLDSSKLDLIAELLSQLVVSREEEFAENLRKESENFEEEFRSKYFILGLTENQRNLFVKLFKYRAENKKKYSDKIEDLFFYMFLKYVKDDWFEDMPDGFKVEFKEAFVEYFQSKEKPEEEDKEEEKD